MQHKRRILDTHAHVWKVDGKDILIQRKIAALDSNFSLEMLEEEGRRAFVERVIIVQATSTLRETEDLLARFQKNPFVHGIIGWVDIEAPRDELIGTIDRLKSNSAFLGIRAYPKEGFNIDWLSSEPVVNGLKVLASRGVPIDFLVNFKETEQLISIMNEVGSQPAILNHAGRPFVMTGELSEWAEAIGRLARETSIVCKVSGLIERAGVEWTAASLKPWIAALLETFGPERLIFASNWPVMTLMGRYSGWIESVETILEELGLEDEHKDMIFYTNALRTYRRPSQGT